MLVAPVNNISKQNGNAKPFCECPWWTKRTPVSYNKPRACSCGEDDELEWKWESPRVVSTEVMLSDDEKQVTFHKYYSSGTALVKGNSPLGLNNHYYWEVKMLTDTYGTDIVVGLGTSNVDVTRSQFRFTSLLGEDAESYGLSYTGAIRHNAIVAKACHGFCKGTIIGVRVDMWRGTLEFYLNRKPQGVIFYNLRRHLELYPMLSSTAAQSSMRLVYASSWRASLLVDAAKILAASVTSHAPMKLPPGLWNLLRARFWLTLPSEEWSMDE